MKGKVTVIRGIHLAKARTHGLRKPEHADNRILFVILSFVTVVMDGLDHCLWLRFNLLLSFIFFFSLCNI